MSIVIEKRAQQGLFEGLSNANRFISGGMFGAAATAGVAAGGNQGAYSTANATTWTDITNTSFNFIIPHPIAFEYRVFATAFISAGTQVGYIRGNMVGYNTSASLLFNATTYSNGLMFFFSTNGPIQAGSYSAKMQAATDSSATSITIVQFFHQVFIYGV